MRSIAIAASLFLGAFIATWTALADDRQIINGGNYQGDTTGDSRYIWSRKDNANFLELFSRSSAYSNSVKRLLANIAINVKDPVYGAVGDGTTDDTSAIRDAVSSAPSGATLLFPNGTYVVTGSVFLTKPVHISGHGATLKNISGGTMFVPQASDIVIDGLGFDTTQHIDPPVAAIFGNSAGVNNLRIDRCKFNLTRLLLFDGTHDTNVVNSGLWIGNNSFTGNFTGTTCCDQSQLIEILGYSSVFIINNTATIQNEERWMHVSPVIDSYICGNVFTSLGTSISGAVVLDLYGDTRRSLISDNVFNIGGTSTYQSVIYMKVSPSFFQATDLDISRNVINIVSTSASCIPIDMHGPYGQPENTMRQCNASIHDNVINITAPNSTDAVILARGWSQVKISGNSISTPDRLDYRRAIDAANNRDIIISGNNIEFGFIDVGGASNTPQGSLYLIPPQSLTISANTITAFKPLAGIYLDACTNISSVSIVGNTISTSDGSSADALFRFHNCANITNLIIVGNSAPFSDATTDVLLSGDTTVANFVHANNSWQSPAALNNTAFITQSGTDLVVDFHDVHEFLTCDLTNDVSLSVSNCVRGKTIVLRLHAEEADRTIDYPIEWVVMQGVPYGVSSNHTVLIKIHTFATDCSSNGNVVVEPASQVTEENYLRFWNVEVQGLHANGITVFDAYTRLDNNTWHYGRNTGNDSNIAMIGIDSANQVNLAPGGDYTTIGGGLKMGNTPGITTNLNVIIAGGTTNQLQFLHGILTGNVPQ